MFRRRWTALPADPVFPSDLKELGYFVNEVDEIRSIADPNKYFKFFISKNMRWNERQRFHMNAAVEALVHTRLEQQGLSKTLLPLGTPPTSAHVPIFTSANLRTARRIVVLFGESAQELGILAHRVLGGPGGVNKGSMVSVARAFADSFGKDEETGLVIANPGQLFWWPEGARGLTPVGRFAAPMQSAVHRGRAYDARMNAIPGHETVGRHVRSVFEEVLGGMASEDAKLAVVAVTDVADEVERLLDDEENWKVWGPRMESLALLGNYYGIEGAKCDGFREFLKNRTRSWMIDPEPLDVALANPEGTLGRAGVGCPVFSAGPDAHLAELLLIHTHPSVFKWMREVAETEDYRNPRFQVLQVPPEPDSARYWKDEIENNNKDVGGDAAESKKATEGKNKDTDHKKSVAKEVTDPVEANKSAVTHEQQKEGHDAEKPEEIASAEKKPVPDDDTKPADETETEVVIVHSDPKKGATTFTTREAVRREIRELTERYEASVKKEQEERERMEKEAKKKAEEKAKLEHMRREVLAALEQVEKMAALQLEDGDKGMNGDEDSDSDEE